MSKLAESSRRHTSLLSLLNTHQISVVVGAGSFAAGFLLALVIAMITSTLIGSSSREARHSELAQSKQESGRYLTQLEAKDSELVQIKQELRQYQRQLEAKDSELAQIKQELRRYQRQVENAVKAARSERTVPQTKQVVGTPKRPATSTKRSMTSSRRRAMYNEIKRALYDPDTQHRDENVVMRQTAARLGISESEANAIWLEGTRLGWYKN